MKILVSACLLGLDCRYNQQGKYHEKIACLAKTHQLIPVCPEQLGGLSTPREPAELVAGQVLAKNRHDVTREFKKGAAETLKLAKIYQCTHAILKSNSPSCGYGFIYDGTFSGQLIKGNGLAADALSQAGLTIWNENNLGNH